MRQWGVALVALAGLIGCTDPPRGNVAVPDPTEPPPVEDTTVARDGYALEREGTAPDPVDVAFEEDALEPPESVEASAFEREPVAASTEAPTPVEPTVQVPAPQTVSTPVRAAEPTRGERGFRVQLLATTEPADAADVAREAKTRLGLEVYVEFESPYYKVRAGDYVDRAEALLLRDRSRSLGYDKAWVVTTEIRVRSTP